MAAHPEQVLIGLAVVLLAARLFGELLERLGQPPVLGELAAGMLLGNAALAGAAFFEPLKHNAGLELMAEIGVVLLLFETGLHSRVSEMVAVGWSALVVAHLGVIAPGVLGYAVSAWFRPDAAWYVHLFVGATLTATSVGITARVLQDLRQTNSKEGQIILGAAVVDDVLGLIVLAVVSGMVSSVAAGGSGTFVWMPVVVTIAKAAAFLVGAVVLGRHIHVNALKLAKRFRTSGVTLALAVCFCFSMASLAAVIGLAPIVGAFAAGLVLEDDDYADFKARGVAPIAQLVNPLTTVFVPVFFVMMGLRVDLRVFADMGTVVLAAAITAAAVLGKQVCALGVMESGVSRLAVAVGMTPRGEVGLIFVGIGAAMMVAGKPLLDQGLVSALVAMVMLTTVVTPPLLKAVFPKRAS